MTLADLDLNKTYTYADYLKWTMDEYVELIKGKIFQMSPAPYSFHQAILTNIFVPFGQYFKGHQCKLFVAPFDVRIPNKSFKDEDIITVVQPDICVICDPAKIDLRGCLGAPDLLVEIVSKSTIKKDINEKFNLYEAAGVREYWIVFPSDKFVAVYYLEGEKYVLKANFEVGEKLVSHIFPDFEMPVDEVFDF